MIVDDELLARSAIRMLLKDDPEIQIVAEAGSGPEAVELIVHNSPDLVFLDIQMPGMNGFDVLESLGTINIPVVIFVTAFDKYAVKAFEVHALDYLLKPFDDARFGQALRQAKSHIEQGELNRLTQKLFALLEYRDEKVAELPHDRPRYLTRLMIKSASRIFFLKVDEIDWIGAEDYYVKLHVGRKSHLLRETMNELETKLDPDKFVRIHRSSIVNMDRVKEMHPHFNSDYLVILQDGTELKLSRSRKEQLQSLLNSTRT
jgi:two-component system LytT family response regulator